MFTGLQDHRKVQTGRNLRRTHSSTSCTKQSLQWFTFPHTFKFWCLNYLIDTWLEVPNWEEVLAVNNQLHPVQICAFMLWNDGMVSWGLSFWSHYCVWLFHESFIRRKVVSAAPLPTHFKVGLGTWLLIISKLNISESDSCLNLFYLKTEMLPHQKMKFRATSL